METWKMFFSFWEIVYTRLQTFWSFYQINLFVPNVFLLLSNKKPQNIIRAFLSRERNTTSRLQVVWTWQRIGVRWLLDLSTKPQQWLSLTCSRFNSLVVYCSCITRLRNFVPWVNLFSSVLGWFERWNQSRAYEAPSTLFLSSAVFQLFLVWNVASQLSWCTHPARPLVKNKLIWCKLEMHGFLTHKFFTIHAPLLSKTKR